jgi:hypothetical protein
MSDSSPQAARGIPQARLAPEEILGFGIGEENPAIPVKENGEPGLKKSVYIFWKFRRWPAHRARRSQKTGG